MKGRLAKLLLAPWPGRLVRWALGAVFLYAAILKLQDPEAFAGIIDEFGLVPEGIIMPLALGLPLVEIAAGLGLAANRRWALATTAGLLMLFIGILIYALWLDLDVDCGCFGPADPEYQAFHSLWSALYRDLVMLGGVAFLYGRDLALRRTSAA